MSQELLNFQHYKKAFDKYWNFDPREINFQNRIIINLLENILLDENKIEVVDVSVQFENKNSNIHSRSEYAGEHTPDLLIAKNWNYKNKNNKEIQYIALIEIKSPVLDPINKLNLHTENEIKCYLNLQGKVILTDCIRWYFYDKTGKETFDLYDLLFNYQNSNIDEWNKLCYHIKYFLTH